MAKSRRRESRKQNSQSVNDQTSGTTRREFLAQATLAAAALALHFSPSDAAAVAPLNEKSHNRPNILMFHSDEHRSDFVGCRRAEPYGQHPKS